MGVSQIMNGQVRHSDWKELYWLSGIGAIVSEVVLILGAVLFFIWPYAPGRLTTEEVFALLRNNPVGGAVSLDLLLLVGNVVALLLFLALFVSLRPVNPSYALVALGMGLIAVALIVPARPIVEMFNLSGKYAAADAAAKSNILAAGDAVLAMFDGTSWAANTILGGLSLLISSILMLRSERYNRLTGYVGIIVNIAVCSFFIPVVGIYLLALAVPGYILWYALLAAAFFRAART